MSLAKQALLLVSMALFGVRAVLPAELSAEELFRRGSDLIEPYMAVVDRESADPNTPEAKKQINEGIELLTAVTKKDPGNWSAFWFIGKGEQARRNHAAAEIAFQRAFELKP